MLHGVSPLVGISTCIRPIEGHDWHAVQDRAGSGNLNSGDKWNFCLTLA